jgi:hypothetical protein
MLLLLRFTGHKKLATVLGLLTSVASVALAVVTHHQTWLITAIIGLGLSFLQLRHQRREDAGHPAGPADQS